MILVCPTCRTRYTVDDETVRRPSGRTVRCAHCGHSWQHLTPPPMPPPLLRLRERIEAAPPPPPPAASVETPARPVITAPRQGGHSGLGWAILILLLGGIVVAAILGRDKVVALWPPAAQYYALIGLQSEPLGVGLDIAHVTSTRNPDGLIVEGDITNQTKVPRAVPHLRVALRDAGQKELIFKVIEPPRERLLPGETSHFVVGFLPAPDAAAGVVVTFVAS